jgi:uncharacterized protein YdhG (YjbR/CyaY superfamily)
MDKEARHYIDAVPEGKAHFEQLHALILALYPEAEIGMSQQVPTYTAQSGWVAVGYWKYGISLYADDSHYINELKERYPGIRTENGGVHIKVTETMPLALLRRIIRHAIERPTQAFNTANEVARHRRIPRPHLQYNAGNNA